MEIAILVTIIYWRKRNIFSILHIALIYVNESCEANKIFDKFTQLFCNTALIYTNESHEARKIFDKFTQFIKIVVLR